jgi:hypothetical protein
MSRELLEAAAKAAGISLEPYTWDKGAPWGEHEGFTVVGSGRREWNPLTDDGDALRLAVKIGEPFVVRSRCVTTMGGLMEDFNPAVPGDDLRATRRAITRAAAQIGGGK